LFEGNSIAKNGKISISDKPGLGYTLDKSVLATLALKE
jgi:L-alanine-DL-glutamate epimerase-like enolase superfamily enzyme